MKRDPMAIAAAVAAARILGMDCVLGLFVEAAEADAVTAMVADILGSRDATYRPPSGEQRNGVFGWMRDGDGKAVCVNVHVLPATANDNQGAAK